MQYRGGYILDFYDYTPKDGFVEAETVEEAAAKFKVEFPPTAFGGGPLDTSSLKRKWIILTWEGADGHNRGERLDFDTCTVL